MTDKEAYKELLARTGVVFQEDEWGISSLTIHATEERRIYGIRDRPVV
jgi:hypothetical protein